MQETNRLQHEEDVLHIHATNPCQPPPSPSLFISALRNASSPKQSYFLTARSTKYLSFGVSYKLQAGSYKLQAENRKPKPGCVMHISVGQFRKGKQLPR